jgi:hypothetical protein
MGQQLKTRAPHMTDADLGAMFYHFTRLAMRSKSADRRRRYTRAANIIRDELQKRGVYLR